LCRIENQKQGIKISVLENISTAFQTTPAKFLEEFEKNEDE
jgi:hypothetical protein